MSQDNNYLDDVFKSLDNKTSDTVSGHDLTESSVSPSDVNFADHHHDHEHDHVHEAIQIGHEPFVMVTYNHEPVDEGIIITPATIRIGNMPTEKEAVIAHLKSVIQMLEQDEEVRFDPVAEAQG